MQSINNSNKHPTFVTFNGHLEFGNGKILLDKKSIIEYPIPALLISTKKSTSFFECQEYFDEKQNAFIKSGKKGTNSSKIVRLFIDKSGFYIYLETFERYIYFRRAIHVEIGYKTLQVITEFDGHYYGILVWIYDLKCKIEQYTSFIKYFYQNLCFRLLKGEPDNSKSCDIFEYPLPSFKVDLPFFTGGKQRKDKIFGQKSQTEHDQHSIYQYFINPQQKLLNLTSRSRENPLALSKTSELKGYEKVQHTTKSRASTSNEYEVINTKLVLNKTKPGDLTSTGVVSSARRAQQPPTTASINRNVAGCSAGPSEQQIISTLKDCKITSSTVTTTTTTATNSGDEDRIGGKSTSSNGAGDTPTNETAGQSEIPEIETALNNKIEVDKFLEFLNQQYCSENLYFYFAVQKYKAIAPDDAKGRCDIGNQIFERHFAQNCNEPVNVEYATNKAICEAKKANNFQPETYDHAQYQIFHLLKYDVWPRYIRSEAEKRPSRGAGENDVSSEHTETSSTSTSYRKLKNFLGRKLQPVRNSTDL